MTTEITISVNLKLDSGDLLALGEQIAAIGRGLTLLSSLPTAAAQSTAPQGAQEGATQRRTGVRHAKLPATLPAPGDGWPDPQRQAVGRRTGCTLAHFCRRYGTLWKIELGQFCGHLRVTAAPVEWEGGSV